MTTPAVVVRGDLMRLEQLGEGTYGTVFKVRNKKSGALLAMKQIKLNREEDGIPPSTIREITFLKSIHHQNVVAIKHVVPAEGELCILFELMSQDLRQYMNMKKERNEKTSVPEIKSYSFQIFQGINYCHRRRIFHRDLKPQNILLDDSGGLKLGDFGLAKLFGTPTRVHTFDISTLWYRAPEILLEFADYGPGVDIWSVGCIVAELVKGDILFKGLDKVDQVVSIFRVLGTPRESTWPGVSQSSIYQEISYSVEQTHHLREEVETEDPLLADLIQHHLLMYNPKKRLTAEQALQHHFFSSNTTNMETS